MFLFLFVSAVFYSCEKKDDSIIDPSISTLTISDPIVSNDTIYTTSSAPVIDLNVSVRVLGDDSVDSLTCKVLLPDGSQLGSFRMSDNGDGRYSSQVNVTSISCLTVGQYRLEFLAVGSTGLASNLLTSNIYVVNTANTPPNIVSTDLPDSVVRPAAGAPAVELTISTIASDLDGLCDIENVTLTTIRPNGVINIPIPLFNTGENGRYAITAPVNSSEDPTSYGYFKYIFKAQDRSGAVSFEYRDSIKFVRP